MEAKRKAIIEAYNFYRPELIKKHRMEDLWLMILSKAKMLPDRTDLPYQNGNNLLKVGYKKVDIKIDDAGVIGDIIIFDRDLQSKLPAPHDDGFIGLFVGETWVGDICHSANPAPSIYKTKENNGKHHLMRIYRIME